MSISDVKYLCSYYWKSTGIWTRRTELHFTLFHWLKRCTWWQNPLGRETGNQYDSTKHGGWFCSWSIVSSKRTPFRSWIKYSNAFEVSAATGRSRIIFSRSDGLLLGKAVMKNVLWTIVWKAQVCQEVALWISSFQLTCLLLIILFFFKI